MSHKVKVVSLLFSLENAVSPFRMIRDIERFFKCADCVVSLKALCGDLFIVTLRDSEVVEATRKQSTLLVNGYDCRYKEVETNIIGIKVLLESNVSQEDITRALRPYATVMVCYELHEGKNYYFAVIELKKDLPTKITTKNDVMFEVIEL